MVADLVDFQISGNIGHLRLNRPDASNAFNLEVAESFAKVVDAIEAQDDVRAILLTGAGKRFCAGGDVASFAAAGDPPAYLAELADSMDRSMQRLADMPKPVVVAVAGAVAGAGLGLMLTADLIVAARGTKFVTAYSGIGLTPDCGVSWLLPRAVGHVRAMEMLVGERVLDADQALEWGLVGRVVDDAEAAAQELAASLAAGPSTALGQAGVLARSAWQSSRAQAGKVESTSIAAAVTTDEAQTRIAGFLNR